MMIAETIRYRGFNGELVDAYLARPTGDGAFPSVVVIHHSPGWDDWTKEVVRRFAHHGYSSLCPNLFSRESIGLTLEQASSAVRRAGGVSDRRAIGDISAAVDYLRVQPTSNKKIGVIGFCSGGRLAYLVSCHLEIEAAVDCYGGSVVTDPEKLNVLHPIAPIDLTPQMSCPLLGLFGSEDPHVPLEHVAILEEALKHHEKTYEFYVYENTGHAFFCSTSESYRVNAAIDGWTRILEFFGRQLASLEETS
jgi:carboxymethylenebutenolidase